MVRDFKDSQFLEVDQFPATPYYVQVVLDVKGGRPEAVKHFVRQQGRSTDLTPSPLFLKRGDSFQALLNFFTPSPPKPFWGAELLAHPHSFSYGTHRAGGILGVNSQIVTQGVEMVSVSLPEVSFLFQGWG